MIVKAGLDDYRIMSYIFCGVYIYFTPQNLFYFFSLVRNVNRQNHDATYILYILTCVKSSF